MADRSDYLKKAQGIWSQVRAFAKLWLALICLGGFVVLIGGPWVLGLLTKIFGPAAAKPGRVISLDMLFTLPFAIFFWIQQRRLAEGNVVCSQCGEQYPKTNSSCPMCGCANPEQNATKENPPGGKVASAKSNH